MSVLLIEPELRVVAIVLVGSLNPKIFTPDWFARNGLLTPREADAAEVDIVHQQVTQFRAGWLTILVETNRLVATTTEPQIQLRDLVVRTFREFLSHTPIGMLGINLDVHFSVGSTKTRDQIGYKLAPPGVWGEWEADIRAAGNNVHGGMQSVAMRQTAFANRPAGYTQATVQPSVKIKNEAGIYMQVNDHYQVNDPDKVSGCEEIIGYLADYFDKSIKRSEWIINQVMALRDG